uniref:Uncharacterized protein n=1 Tax=Anguilla anguilla TaxID=7936 RepID=A0A0E9TZU4_ANGAN
MEIRMHVLVMCCTGVALVMYL